MIITDNLYQVDPRQARETPQQAIEERELEPTANTWRPPARQDQAK